MSLPPHQGTAIAASSGIVVGKVQKLAHGRQPIPERQLKKSEIASELRRLNRAVENALIHLDQERKELEGIESQDPFLILGAHRMMLLDPELIDKAKILIKEKQINAEWAIRQQMDEIEAVFDTIEDAYLRDRKLDVEQAGQRILRELMGPRIGLEAVEGNPQILISHDFTPSEIVAIWRLGVAGIATEQGGINAHSVIVARSIGLPALVGTSDLVETAQDGDLLILDAERGKWILNPSGEELESYARFKSAFEIVRDDLNEYADQPSISANGHAMPIMANIQFREELARVRAVHAEGIGLFRTEFLFMQSNKMPGEEAQYEHYRQIVEGMQGKPVIFRLLDVGGDKPLLFQLFSGARYDGQNPAMGLRGIRLLLNWPEGMKTQLRALLRAAVHGRVSLLVPMVSSVAEMEHVREVIEICKGELGMAGDMEIPLGAMIEIPAAVFIADELARVSDFFSIGTNDLIQYALAADRADEEVSSVYQSNHPAIRQMIEMTVKAARRADIPVSVCGELAADPEWTQTFLNMGMDSLSMNLHNILRIRHHLNHLDYQPER